jgi:hypothetical protein
MFENGYPERDRFPTMWRTAAIDVGLVNNLHP